MSFFKLSPITGACWDDARGPIGFLGGVSKLVLDTLPATRKDMHHAVIGAHDAACTFAALPVLAYTGEEGLVVSQVYEKAQIASRQLTPLIDDLFKTNRENWRQFVTPYEESCWMCVSQVSNNTRQGVYGRPGSPINAPNDCDYCDNTGTYTYSGIANDASPALRAVRIAFATTHLIMKVATNQHTDQISDRLHDIFDGGVAEAQASGIPQATLEKQELAWRFYVIARRMPKDDEEELFLAFQAAWDTGNYMFAKQMVQSHEAA